MVRRVITPSAAGRGAIRARRALPGHGIRVRGHPALHIDELPVVADERPDEIMTMLSKQDIVNYYHECCLA